MDVVYKPFHAYNAHEKIFTTNQNHHCSTCFFASTHIPKMLKAVVKLSPYGTGLSVYFNNIDAINTKSRVPIIINGKIYLFGV